LTLINPSIVEASGIEVARTFHGRARRLAASRGAPATARSVHPFEHRGDREEAKHETTAVVRQVAKCNIIESFKTSILRILSPTSARQGKTFALPPTPWEEQSVLPYGSRRATSRARTRRNPE